MTSRTTITASEIPNSTVAVVGESPSAMAYGGLAAVLAGLLLVIWAELRTTRPAAGAAAA